MSDSKVSALSAIGSIDRASDLLYVVDASGPTSNKIVINTLLGITGNPVGHTDTQTLSNKTLGNTNILTVRDDRFTLQDSGDTTRQAVFQLSGISGGTTRTYTLPNATTTLVGTDATQTLTSKTLTSPVINTATISNPTLTVDAISEFTAAAGVTVDGLLIKDGLLPAGNIQPLNLVSGTGASWVWQSWVPTWTNLTVGNGTVTAKYTQIGKTVFFRIVLVLGGTSSVGTAPTFTFPVTSVSYTATATVQTLGPCRAFDSAVGSYDGTVAWASTTTGTLQVQTSGGTYSVPTPYTATVPFTFGSTDEIYLQGSYEAA